MPIIKSEENAKIQFGTGDISIGAGMTNYEKDGLVTFVEQEIKDIGVIVKSEDPYEDTNNFPVSFVFTKVESIDVLIERLQTTKKYMTGELDIMKLEY
ncbi:hypothetical protein [Terrihalobacillus insolitus]|uniref:hypothetical protein n=1 Tax=Terrihalobacillus insolitus TaxID=2950438 RepID=UPI00234167E8|nr:hypothetical protein [Terrihalobacillus insolitus]MDC3412546.1 hypothetical protein [Terrihalobacillus insolitus]